MRTFKSMWLLTVWCMACLALCAVMFAGAAGGAGGAEKQSKSIENRAFTDPLQQTKMPPEWVNKPIKYEQETGDADIAVSLEQDVYQLILPIIERYGKENKLKIAVKKGTCGIAAGMLSRKSADIGGFCCPAGREDRLPGIKFHTIGIVAKVLFVHPENTVEGVTMEQARDIFRGRIARWSELKDGKGRPGPEWPIRTIGRFHCKNRPGHWYLLLPDDKMFSPKLHEVGSIPDMISQIASSKQAIGWEVIGMAELYKNLGGVKALKINGYSPAEQAAVASKKYPIYRTYNLTTWEGRTVENAKAQRLVQYIIKEAEKLDPKSGFAPVSKLRKAGWKFRGDELTGEPK